MVKVGFKGKVVEYKTCFSSLKQLKLCSSFFKSVDKKEKEKLSWLLSKSLVLACLSEIYLYPHSKIKVDDSSILKGESKSPDVTFYLGQEVVEGEVKSSSFTLPNPSTYQEELLKGYCFEKNVVFIGLFIERNSLTARVGKLVLLENNQRPNFFIERRKLRNMESLGFLGGEFLWRKRLNR